MAAFTVGEAELEADMALISEQFAIAASTDLWRATSRQDAAMLPLRLKRTQLAAQAPAAAAEENNARCMFDNARLGHARTEEVEIWSYDE